MTENFASRLFSALFILLLSMPASADILVVSRDTNSIVVFDDTGAFVSSVALPASGSQPGDLAAAPNGDIFVLRQNGVVQRFDSALSYIGSWSASSRQYGINVDEAGLVYVAGSASASVGVYDANGVLQTSLTPSGGSNLRDTVRVGTDTWVSNFTGSKIDIINNAGVDVGDVATDSAPFGMQKAPNGDVWVVDQNSHQVRRITPAGAQAFSFDADDGPNGPLGDQLRYLGVGPDGKLYIPHRDSNIVDVYDETGTHLATLSDASLDGPDGILVTGEFTPSTTASIKVTKVFSDGRDDEVDVTLTCNSGLPLSQSFTIAGGDPDGVTFIVTELPDDGANCEVTESGGPDNYTPVMNDGDGCAWTNVRGSRSCEIVNYPDPAEYTVEKDWIVPDAGYEEMSYEVDVVVTCESAITMVGTSSYYGGSSWTGVLDDGDVVTFMVDTEEGGTRCSAEEFITQSGVEGTASAACGGADLDAGDSATCTFTNTVFFEGIPTLSQYGLAVLALLMLGVGFIGFRRFV